MVLQRRLQSEKITLQDRCFRNENKSYIKSKQVAFGQEFNSLLQIMKNITDTVVNRWEKNSQSVAEQTFEFHLMCCHFGDFFILNLIFLEGCRKIA